MKEPLKRYSMNDKKLGTKTRQPMERYAVFVGWTSGRGDLINEVAFPGLRLSWRVYGQR